MKIEPAATADALAIAKVHVASWQSAYKDILPSEWLASLSVTDRSAMWARILNEQAAHVWIVKDVEQVQGFISFSASRDADALAQTAEIQAIYLLPDQWLNGLGRALMDTAIEQVKQLNFERITLWVLSDNQRAIRFYERMGFAIDAGAIKSITLGGKTVQEQRYLKIE
jgi:L-amino acid N-acyltransferase YncA